MTLHRLMLFALLAVLSLAAVGCGGDDDAEPGTAATENGAGGGTTLRGSVGPGFDISLSGTEGLTAGDYTIVVEDMASSHNFHLTGPGGVDVSTGVGDQGQETFEVTLEPGEYRFVCDPHASSMRGSFTVG